MTRAVVRFYRSGLAATLMSALTATPALAQLEIVPFLIPTEVSLGVGAVADGTTKGAPVFNIGLSNHFARDQWIEPAVEVGAGPTSDEALCQTGEAMLDLPASCVDLYVVVGPRFRPLRESDRRWRPYVHVLVGGYWRGTGLEEPEALPATTAFQVGGGMDLRRPTSIHGIRLSADYRRVFAGERGRHQAQALASYFVGWRGPKRTDSPQRTPRTP